MIVFLLTLMLACTPALQTEESITYDTEAEEEIVFGIQVDGVCGHAVGDEICDLILKDQNDDAWSLYDLEGDVVLLDFSAMWCAPVNRQLPRYKKCKTFMRQKDFIISLS